MEMNLTTTVLIANIVLTGLTAGLCFTWSNAITPGIGQLDDLGFLQSFQQMNRVIINPTFIIVFFGPFVTNLIILYLRYPQTDKAFWLFAAAAALFILGVVIVTIFRNVPLNEMLDKTDLVSASVDELKTLRQKFEKPWNQWHMVRTVCSIASFVLLLIGFILIKQ